MREKPPPLASSPTGRLYLPVITASHGAGASTLAGLLAGVMDDAVVLDVGARVTSPWAEWSTGGEGLAALPPDRPVRRSAIRAAASVLGATGAVLTDRRPWSSPPLHLPVEPAAWYQLGAAGGWASVLVDTGVHLAEDLVTARHTTDHRSLAARWCALPGSVAIFAVDASGSGVRALQLGLQAALADGLPVDRAVVALIGGPRRLPAPVQAARTMLTRHVAAVLHLPHEAQIRAHGLSRPLPPRSGVRTAARDLAVAAAEVAAGLPVAPDPCPLSTTVSVKEAA